jgi:hypothetical protein
MRRNHPAPRSRLRGLHDLSPLGLLLRGLLFAFSFGLLFGVPLGLAVAAGDPTCSELVDPPRGRGIIVDLHVYAVNWAIGWLLPEPCMIRMPIVVTLAIFLMMCELLGWVALSFAVKRLRRRA